MTGLTGEAERKKIDAQLHTDLEVCVVLLR